MKYKLLPAILAVSMIASIPAGCGNQMASSTGTATADSEEQVIIKLFSNLPDRKNGQGLIEQMIIDEYMAENANIKIEVEALDEEAYKTKFKAYSMEGLPDVVSIWGQPAFLDEVLDAGVLTELDEAYYADYGFVNGSLEGFKKSGKLYGLPRNTDVASFFYNQKMFEDHGWKIPATYGELLELAETIRKDGIIPLAMDGGDGWPMAVYLSDILFKLTGDDYTDIVSDAVKTGDFSDSELIRAVEILRETADAGLFQEGYDSQDAGTAMNLFTTGQAAMFYMGSWQISLLQSEDIPEDIRTNIRIFTMPVIEGGKGTASDIAAWNGGGYAVSASSEIKEEAVRFLNYLYRPDKLSRYGWENGIGMSAQDQSTYMSGNETELQKQFVEAVTGASGLSGTPINDCGPSAFKTVIENEIQSVSNGTISVDEFLNIIGKACK